MHVLGNWGDCASTCNKGCHVSEQGSRKLQPCVFPFGRIINGKTRFFNKCVDTNPEKPRGVLMCSTKVNETTGMHINGGGHWGICEKEFCPSYKGNFFYFSWFFLVSIRGKILVVKMGSSFEASANSSAWKASP